MIFFIICLNITSGGCKAAADVWICLLLVGSVADADVAGCGGANRDGWSDDHAPVLSCHHRRGRSWSRGGGRGRRWRWCASACGWKKGTFRTLRFWNYRHFHRVALSWVSPAAYKLIRSSVALFIFIFFRTSAAIFTAFSSPYLFRSMSTVSMRDASCRWDLGMGSQPPNRSSVRNHLNSWNSAFSRSSRTLSRSSATRMFSDTEEEEKSSKSFAFQCQTMWCMQLKALK